MCVNDIMTCGAQPIFFLSCFDCAEIDPNLAKKVISGIAKGCEMAQCALVGKLKFKITFTCEIFIKICFITYKRTGYNTTTF